MVQEGVAQAAGGQFDTQRYLLMFSPTKDKVRTLFAAEGYYTNGPYEHDNRYFRTNLFGKMTTNLTGRDELSLTGTFQKSQWNASGEIPLRAVKDGTLDRFGAIDPSEGGKTLRSTARLNYHYDTTSGGQFFANAYGQYYRLDLFTNFTFFLNDPVNGDGIQQSDRRVMYGGRSRIQTQRRGVWGAEYWNDRISNQSGRYPCETGDPNDENADREHHGQRYS